jgi:large subunit ribosomal protein L13
MKQNVRNIHKIDAKDQAVGRIATKIALILRGKNKPEYEPHLDNGDIVEVTNTDKMSYSGKKLQQKKYLRYSGYPGGLKETKMSDLAKTRPAEILRRAVREMLPPTRLRPKMLKRLLINGSKNYGKKRH